MLLGSPSDLPSPIYYPSIFMRRRNPLSSSKDPHVEMIETARIVKKVYEDLSTNPPERNCTLQTECCRFQITGKTPMLTKGEAVVAAKALRAAGRTKLPERADGACPLLHPYTSRCMVYAGRPFGCRTHFCEAAGGPYERKEVIAHIRILEEVDERLGGDGPRALQPAIRDALAELF